MKSGLLYINDQLIDLYPDTVIAQTIQAFDIGALGSVRLSYTNQIKIPKTGRNRQIAEFANDSKSGTSFPYTTHSARYVKNGIEIIRNGVIELQESANEFMFNIYSGPVSFFDFIKTKKLWDLDFSDLNGAWHAADIDGYRNATTGIVAALVNDGHLELSGSDINNRLVTGVGDGIKMPQVYYHTIIDKIFSDAGYAKSGNIFSDDAYLKLVMPLRVHYNDAFVEAKGFSASADGTQVIVDPAAYTNIQFVNVGYIGADNFYNGTDQYEVVNPDTAEFYFICNFEALIDITVAGGTVDIMLEITSTGSTSDTQTALGTGTYTLEVTTLNGMKDGDIVRLKVIKNAGTPTVTINSGVFRQKPYKTVAEDMVRSNITPYFVYFNLLFDDINQIDFIKDFSVRFNVRMTERSGVIVCKTFDEILSETSIDWSAKRVGKEQSIRYTYDGLAQSNYFGYATDDVASEVTEDYGKGLFTISNETLSETKAVYTSIIAMSQMISAFNVFMIDLDRDYDSVTTGAYDKDIGSRLFYVRDRYSYEPAALYQAATPRTDYLVGYFIDPKQTNSMHWQYFIDSYYAGFITRLQKTKTLTRKYRLSDVDIHTFDQLKPIYDDGDIFIVTKINNYVSGFAPEVELFKIN